MRLSSIFRTAAPQSLVILMTAYGTTQTAIEAMKHGAFDYVLKPFESREAQRTGWKST